MKKGLIGILSSIVILGSGFFISNMNTSNKDVHKNEKTKQEKVIKEEKNKKEDNKDDSKKIEKDKDIVEESIKDNKKDKKTNSKNIEKDSDVVEKAISNSKNTNFEEIKTETSKNRKPVKTPQAEVKNKVIESTNIEKNINQSDGKNIQKDDKTSLEKQIPLEENIPCDSPYDNSCVSNKVNETNESIGTNESPNHNVGVRFNN